MKNNRRIALLFVVFAGTVLLALNFTPTALTQNKKVRAGTTRKKDVDPRKAAEKTAKGLKKGDGRNEALQSSILIEQDADDQDAEDPDLPPWLAGKIDKEAYLRLRSDYVDLIRGRPVDLPDDPRESALRQMAEQELQMKQRALFSLQSAVNTTNWSFLGPAPIPLGQTSTTRVPVSGRTISIAVHPEDENTVYVGTAQGGLYKSVNGGVNWSKLFEFQLESLAIGAITIDPKDSSVVYIGTGEPNLSADSFAGRGLYIIRDADSETPILTGPFRQDSGGNNVLSGRSIGRIVVNPFDRDVLFVCTTSGTGGNPSASPINLPPRGIYRSTNAQSANPTFSQVQITGISVPNDRTTVDLALDPGDPNLLLAAVVGAGGDGGIYRTTNALDPTPTFTRTLVLPSGATNGRAELYLVRNASGVTIYAATGEISSVALGGPACSSGSAGMLRRSTDGGQTWSTPLPGSTGFCGGQCFYDMALAVTPDNQTIHLGGAARGGSGQCLVDVMKRSTNGGTSFVRNDVTLHADEHALAIAPSNPLVVYTGNDGGIWRSTNNGTTWTSLNNADFSATQFQSVALHPFDRFFLIGGTQDNGTNCLGPDGVTWGHCRDGDGGYVVIDDNAQDTTNVLMYHTFFNQTNSQIAFERATSTAANAIGAFAWTFRGCSGTTSNNGIRCADNVLFYAPMAQGPGNPNTIYFGTDRLYRSTNRGDTMTAVSQAPLVPSAPAGSGVTLTTIAISPQDDNVRIVGLRNGRVFATTTGSSTMTDVTGANFPVPNPSIGRVAIDPNNKFTAYVSFTSFSPPAGQQIFKTTNLNDPAPTWTPASNGIPPVPISAVVVDPQNSNSVFAGTDIGVFHSTDGGANWSPYGFDLPRVAVFDMKLSNVQRMLRVATHGRGIWEIGVPGRQLPVLRDAGATLVAEGCVPANGVIDAHEDVTVRLGVMNIGPGPTETLTVSLTATGGVALPQGPVNYGVIGSGATGFGDFRCLANVDCGDTMTLTFHLQDGTLDLGNITQTITVGTLVSSTTTVETFDGVAAPALPSGWSTARTGNAGLWVTSTTASHSAPNSVFGAGSNAISESTLDSPVVAIPAAPGFGHKAGVQLSFRTSFNTEALFDGGVLEISINGGAFQDILAAGGNFASGGYNGTIGAASDSILTGRQAWTGNSGGFISTIVNLPPAAFSQNVQFRWRTAYDTGTNPNGGGLRIDTITLSTVTFTCCEDACVISCPPNITVPNTEGQCGAIVSFANPAFTGNCGTVTTSPASGSFFPVGTTTVVVTGSRLDGTSTSCSFTVTVNDIQPPAIACPVNITTNTVNAGDPTVAVSFAAPSASDNCSAVTVACVPPSGSQFLRGTTTVTCTATDTSNNRTSCSFTVRVFDYVMVDDSSGTILRFNSATGDYDFFDCRKETTLSGRGQVTITSCKTELLDTGPDPRHPDRNLSVIANPCTRVGNATVSFGGTTHILSDSNMSNNVVGCP